MSTKAIDELKEVAHDHKHEHSHDHDHNCDHEHHHHDHGHAHVNYTVLLFGSVLLINSFLADLIYSDKFISEVSAFTGAVVLSFPVIIAAFKNLYKGRIHMEVLVGLALFAAIARGQYQEAAVIAFFMIVAIAIEEKTAHGAQKSIRDIIKLTPSVARLLRNNDEVEVSVKELSIGDIVRVRPGENFPTDGKVVRGISTVNQASITGESLPVDKVEDNDIFAGTTNLTGSVDVEVTGIGEDTTLGKVKDLIQSAEKSRLPILRMVDQYIGYYTPTILMIALLVLFFTNDFMQFVYVLVIACPCAVVIATPSAVIAAVASAARLGMLIKNVAHIEMAAKIKAVIFDKTGTLTEGKLEVALLNPVEEVELAELLEAAVIAESQSNHPAAQAVVRLAEEANVKWETPSSFEEVAGKGVIAKSGNAEFRAGRASWFADEGFDTKAVIEEFEKHEEASVMSVIYISKDKKMIGWIALRDAVRVAASPAIKELEELGVHKNCMVTGDHLNVAENVAAKVGISDVYAGCLPEQKVECVEKLKAEGYTVAVVGDGVNDAPALAMGDISIAMGAIGSDVAVNSASIALMNNDLRRIPYLVALSRKARTVINLNLAVSIFIIIGGMLLFIFGDSMMNDFNNLLFKDLLGLNVKETVVKSFLAAFLHIVGTLLVVFNSARLVRFGESLENSELT